MRVIRLAMAAAPAALFLAGCNVSAVPEDKEAKTAPDATAETQAQAQQGATPGSSNLWNDGKAKPLEIQVAHANGTVLQLTSLKTDPTSTVVGVRVMNGRDRDIELNRWNSRQGYILLDGGERLYMSPPASNPRISVPSGQSFEGELVFLGRLPKVRTAMLVLNENADTDNEYTSTPGFRIDLPLNDRTAGAAQ